LANTQVHHHILDKSAHMQAHDEFKTSAKISIVLQVEENSTLSTHLVISLNLILEIVAEEASIIKSLEAE
jgi:hypothetical protein